MITGLAPKRSMIGNGALMANVKAALEPPAVETVTVREPGVAFRSIASLTISEVPLPATIVPLSSWAPM